MKNKAMQDIGRLGGKARADALTPERRAEIAKHAANARWHRKEPSDTFPEYSECPHGVPHRYACQICDSPSVN